jgi:CRP-like cAMP-binding protein
MKPGDYFGEISLLENGVATADIVAIEESGCLTMVRSEFFKLFASDPRIGMRMESLAARRLDNY